MRACDRFEFVDCIRQLANLEITETEQQPRLIVRRLSRAQLAQFTYGRLELLRLVISDAEIQTHVVALRLDSERGLITLGRFGILTLARKQDAEVRERVHIAWLSPQRRLVSGACSLQVIWLLRVATYARCCARLRVRRSLWRLLRLRRRLFLLLLLVESLDGCALALGVCVAIEFVIEPGQEHMRGRKIGRARNNSFEQGDRTCVVAFCLRELRHLIERARVVGL